MSQMYPKNFSTILHSQFNYHTLPVTPLKMLGDDYTINAVPRTISKTVFKDLGEKNMKWKVIKGKKEPS